MPLRLVSLDLDGTLIHPAIFNAVADALGFGEPLQESYRLYVEGRMSLEEAFFHDYRHFVGREVAAMHAVLQESKAWTPGIAEAVARLKEAGMRVVVTTDQPRFLAQTTRAFGVDDVVCTEAEVRHGRVTGEVHPSFEKWPNLERHLKAWRIDPADVAHVGNGTNDIPVFERVGYAVGVNALSPRVDEAADESIARVADFNEVADVLLRASRFGMRRVESEAVAALGYDAAARRLRVRFRGDGHYQYLDVPPEEHQALLDAESLGARVNQRVKPRYAHEKE